MTLPKPLAFLAISILAARGDDAIDLRIVTEHPTDEKVTVAYTAKFMIIGTMNPEMTVLARVDATTRRQKQDLTGVPDKTDLLWFFCDGYAPQYAYLRLGGKRATSLDVPLFQERYVTVRYAENRTGPELDSIPGETLALTQYSYPKAGGAWQIMQCSDGVGSPGPSPWICYWQIGDARWGAVTSGQPFDEMKLAPSGSPGHYAGGTYPLEKGSSFYFKDTLGFAKLEVLGIGTDRPTDIKVLEMKPTFIEASH